MFVVVKVVKLVLGLFNLVICENSVLVYMFGFLLGVNLFKN